MTWYSSLWRYVWYGEGDYLRYIVTSLDQLLEKVNDMNDKVVALDATVTSMQATLEAVAVQLGELSAALAAAGTNPAALDAINTRLINMQRAIADAAAAVDITPETPVPGTTPASPPDEPTL